MANNGDGKNSELDVEFTPAESGNEPFVGTSTDDDLGPSERRGARQALKEEAGKLSGQAGEKLRSYADDGKARATGALDELARAIDDAAGTIDEKVGAQFGGYARQASGAITGFSDSLRNKEVDDLLEDAKAFVQKSPAVALGIAAATGFVLARLLRSGVDSGRDRA